MWIFKKEPKDRYIKNKADQKDQRDFRINSVGTTAVIMFVVVSLSIRLLTGSRPSLWDVGGLIGSPLLTTGLITLFPRWRLAVKVLLLILCVALLWNFQEYALIIAFAFFGVVVAPAIQKLEEWERAIILRFGKFSRVRGPGLFLLFPLADRIAKTVDLRIRVTDFSAETTLTRDSVTVTVDALCFWLVWDAEKAVLEVQDYEEAVVLSSKTALRNAVSNHDLSTFLENGEEIENQIREEVDKKTIEWGITVQHIEITDIQIPEGLQDSLSRLAQAEREKKGRVLLAEAEVEIAQRFLEAAQIYKTSDAALQLKKLSVLQEGLKAGNSMMLTPNSLSEELNSTDVFGLQALNELKKMKKEGEQ